jgi:UDP-N-acetyl-L-fucosamine synthase
MQEKLKLMIVLGTRPEIIRLSSVIKKADKCFDLILVHTGQNYDYELNEIFFEELGLRSPDVFLEAVGSDLGETVGNIIAKSYSTIDKYMPDALLVLGDTNSCLAAYAAKRLKVPIFHMEAGNRCFDQNVPEEINRKVVDHLSDVNLPYTEHSRRYLLSEGFKKEYIFVTGSPMAEVLNEHRNEIQQSNAVDMLKLEKGKYIIISAHREENLDDEKQFSQLVASIDAVAMKYDMPVIYSVHPRARKKIEERKIKFSNNVILLKPLGFIDYNALQKDSFVVLSDSGTLSEESNLLNFRAVLIRDSTERPEAIDKGSIIVSGVNKREVINAIDLSMTLAEHELINPIDYMDMNVSDKVVKIIQSYTSIINKFIWFKGDALDHRTSSST